MTRKADEANRSQLLDRIVAYALAKGVASLSLRPLARTLGITPGLLLYHFGSKEALTVEILKHAGERQRRMLADLRERDFDTPGEVCRAIWRAIGSLESRPLFRLFFEVYGLALVDPERFPGFFPAAIENWLAVLIPPFASDGATNAEARILATVVLAGFRGFLLDLCATGDSERVDAAVDHWIRTVCLA